MRSLNENCFSDVEIMPKGDYMIHVLIHEARNLKMDKADTVDPIVEVSLLGRKQFTTCKDDIGYNAPVNWSEHIFFEPKDLTERDLRNARLKIRVLDQQMFKNAVVGVYETDLSFVYFKDKHAVFAQWVGLSNPTAKEFNELSGYLRISASVIGPGDEQIPLPDHEGIDRTDRDVVLLPPHISMHYYQVKFRVTKAEHLPILDTFGTIDAFIKINYLGKTITTKVVTQK